MLENIRLSLRGILSHKLRSFLTMLGIIIGIAAIIAIVSTIQGTNEQIKQNLVGAGSNAVTISLCRESYPMDFTWDGIPDGVPQFDESVKQQLLDLRTVESVSFYHGRTYSNGMFYLASDMNDCALMGIDETYLDAAGFHLIRGRGLSRNDFSNGVKVCLIDKTIANGTFDGEEPLGKILDVQGEPFTIVGVVESKSTFEPTINSIDDWYTYSYSRTGSGQVFVPRACWPLLYGYDEPYTVLLRATSTDDMTSAGADAAAILNSFLSNQEGPTYQSQDLLSQAQELQQLSSATNMMLIWIASISLLVGGIGVMNIMLVSVTERTREIGLKKALGANKRQVLAQFLTEATVLSLLGGLLGVIVGIVLANLIAKLAMVPVSISGSAVLVAVAFSMVVGVVFGLLPSVKASKLNPIDALRYE